MNTTLTLVSLFRGQREELVDQDGATTVNLAGADAVQINGLAQDMFIHRADPYL